MGKKIFLFVAVLGIFFLSWTQTIKAAVCILKEDNSCQPWEDTQGDCEDAGTDGGTYLPAIADCASLPWCFCSDDISQISESNYTTAESNFTSVCQRAQPCSVDTVTKGKQKKFAQCRGFGGDAESQKVCEKTKTDWDAGRAAAIQKFGGFVSGQEATKSSFIPNCAFEDFQGPESACRDVGIFVEMGVNLISYLFGIIGALALLMFIYGGFTLILSGGNPEKVKQGGTIMLSAIIGLVIAFAGYMLVKFISDALVGSNFSLL